MADPEKLEQLKQRFMKVDISFQNPKWVLLYDLEKKEFVQVWNRQELDRLYREGGGGYYHYCSGMCGATKLQRPHFTCETKCRLVRVRDGRIPAVDPVKPVTFMIRLNAARWKRKIAPKVASIYEWLIT